MTPLVALLLAGESPAQEIASWPLDTSDGGFQASGDTDQWEWGLVASGPLSGFDSATAWATVLDGPYRNDSTDHLRLPDLDLTTASRPLLSFTHWYEIDAGDLAVVERKVGAAWEVVEPVYGYPASDGWSGSSGGWMQAWFDLTGIDDASQVRFAFAADDRIALAGWYVDNVVIYDGDLVPPDIRDIAGPSDTQDLDGPYTVSATIKDDAGVPQADLVWAADGGPETHEAMGAIGDVWSADIPGQAPDTTVSWRIEATDGTNQAVAPAGGTFDFRVYLAAPTGLAGPAGRVVALDIDLSWDPPDSPHPVVGYRVWREGEVVAITSGVSASVPSEGPVDTFQVSAMYEIGGTGPADGDLSDSVDVEVHVPDLDPLDPSEAWQGDVLRVVVTGETLQLVQDDCSLDLGDAVDVLDVEVDHADRATFTIGVRSDAPIGSRDGAVVSGDLSIPLPRPFTVLDGEDRPTLDYLQPESVHQGDQATLTIATNFAFAATPEVDAGDGVVVEVVRAVGSRLIEVDVAVANDAPIGDHAITADDGARIVGGVSLDVQDVKPPPQRACATGGAAPWPPALLVIGTRFIRNRRRVTSGSAA